MNNKKGGFGAKLLLVLILMLASAVGGAYAYRVLDGKMAVNDAKKYVDAIRISDYDSEEAVQVETLKEEVEKNLDTATTRKEAYELMDTFKEDLSKIMTKTEKELEEARKAARDAQNNNNNNYNNNNGNNNDYYNNDNSDAGDEAGSYDDGSQDSGNSSNGLLGNLFGNGEEADSGDNDTSN